MFPDNVAIIGGGRWARVFIGVLCELVPHTVNVSVHSPRNAKGVVAWLTEHGLESRVSVFTCLPNFSSEESGVVIVVNAASGHEKAVTWALEHGYPVLVEKPMCLSFFAAKRLEDLALDKKVYLATAHVFLFARYVKTFASMVSSGGDIVSVRVIWMDPQSENRYGETKSYDAGLPIYADWLPHVLSVLGSFLTGSLQLHEPLIFLKGGAHLKIHLNYGQVPCQIEIERNAHTRQRLVEVSTQQKKLMLDFSSEPGNIYSETTILCGDSNWDDKPKPVARMLTAFLKGVAEGMRDVNLDSSIGLTACRVIDQVSSLYDASMASWLVNELVKSQDNISSDFRYALTEILKINSFGPSNSLEQRISYIYQHAKQRLLASTNRKRDAVEIIRTVIDESEVEFIAM